MKCWILLLIAIIVAPTAAPCSRKPQKMHYVYSTYYGGRLGNQLFESPASAEPLAMDNEAEAVFPDYLLWDLYDIPENREKVYYGLNFTKPKGRISSVYREDQDFNFRPIPYSPNMKIYGYFQSEKFFKHNFEKIAPYFELAEDVARYIDEKYHELLTHPCTVAIHLRGYLPRRCFPKENVSLS